MTKPEIQDIASNLRDASKGCGCRDCYKCIYWRR